MGTMTQLFISYSHFDEDIVNALAKALHRRKVTFFLDRKNIGWGERIPDAVRNALVESAALLIVISPASLKSQWVPYEIGYAMGLNAMGDNKKLLPLLTCSALELPMYLSDVRGYTSVDEVMEYVRSSGWKEHCRNITALHEKDVPCLRQTVKTLNELLARYMPGGKEPDDL